MRYLPDGRGVVNFSLATTETWKDKAGAKQERTEWCRCTFFGKAAEVINQYSTKGAVLYVEGKLATRKWTDKNGVDRYTTEIIGDQFQLGPRAKGAEQPAAAGFGAPDAGGSPAGWEPAQTSRTPPAGPLAKDPMGGVNGIPAEHTFTEDDIPF